MTAQTSLDKRFEKWVEEVGIDEAKRLWKECTLNSPKVGPTIDEYFEFLNEYYSQFTRVLRFYKDHEGWFVDLPEWTGGKGALAMVAGADDMLQMMAGENGSEVFLRTNIYPCKDQPWDKLTLVNADNPEGESGGGNYVLETYMGNEVNFPMWLCSVTRFVFGDLPKLIYIWHETGDTKPS